MPPLPYFLSLLRLVLVGLFGVIFCLMPTVVAGQGGSFAVRNFSPAEYGAHPQNFAAVQDQRGFLYVANAAGVLEYDGTQWRTIPTSNGSMVYSLDTDGEVIYVGARDEIGHLQTLPTGALDFRSLNALVPEADRDFRDVRHIFSIRGSDNEQGVYFVARERILKWDSEKIDVTRAAAPIIGAYQVEDQLWVQLEGRGLFQLRNGQLQALPITLPDVGQSELVIKAILPTKEDGQLVVSLRNGLFQYNGKALVALDHPANDLLRTGLVNDAIELTAGNFAVATAYLGMVSFDLKQLSYLGNQGSGLQDQNVVGLYRDNLTGVWALLNEGIARIQWGASIRQFQENNGIEGQVNDVLRFENRLYTATLRGLYVLNEAALPTSLDKNDKPVLQRFEQVPGLDLACYQLMATEDALIVASADGLFSWDGTQLRQLRSEFTFSVARKGNRWYTGTIDSLMVLEGNAGNLQAVESYSAKGEALEKLLVLPSGDLLAQTAAAGIWRLDASGFQALETGGSVMQNQLVQSGGDVFAFNSEGCYRYKQPGFVRDQQSFVASSYQDWLGRVWAFGTDRYFSVDGRGNHLSQTPINAPKLEVFSNRSLLAWEDFSVRCVSKDANNTFWIGGSDGLLHYRSLAMDVLPASPSTSLRNLLLPGDSLVHLHNTARDSGDISASTYDGTTPRLSHNTASVGFRFTALDLDRVRPLRFQYQLEGFDAEWSVPSRETEKEYTNLDYGEYTFRVKAINGYGEEGPVASFSFTIVTPWYAQWWAYLLYGLAFLGATFILVRIRSQRLEKEKRALEKMVEERTSEIQEQKEEIQSQSDSLYIKNKELEKINQMVASINTGISFSAVMGHIIEEIRFIRDVERAASLVLDEATQRFVVRSHHGWEEQQAAEVSLTEAEAEALLLQRSAKVGEDLYYVADGYHSSAIEQHPAFGGAKTSLVLIIRVEDQTRGYLVLECLSKANAFGPQDFDLMASFKEHVVSAFIKSKIMNELQQTFENLQQTQAKLVSQEKMAGLGQLTAGIAHEINNPINFISGNVKPLRRDLDDLKEILEKYAEIEPDSDLEELLEEVEELKEDLDYDFVLDEIDSLINDIENGATRTAEIVKDLRNFSRLDEANLKKASIEDGLDSTLSILKNKYKERIEVVRHYAPLEPIECYAGKLNQVFMNILNNAIQATPDKGTITLTTIDKGEMVEVRLKDTGAGMTEETQKKLFDPFYTTKDVGEGTGLGMSISFGVINDHSGTIEFESELGVGTEFIITLPKKQPKKEEA